MTISGFTMVRNANKYYFPIKESIESILPIVDEFIVALGDNDADDTTRELIESINSPKIKIIDRIWDKQAFFQQRIFADETTFALSQCTGDWCFYLQADEVVHEKDLPLIQEACQQYLNHTEVDGLLFNYHHFFGDYNHYLPVHGWYKNEIRIVRNRASIYSYKDAQSFRKLDNKKLNVVPISAYVYHYGWVRPPEQMQSKKKEQDSLHHGSTVVQQQYQSKPRGFDYGPLGRIPLFKGTHPAVMSALIPQLYWQDQLNLTPKGSIDRPKMKHEKLKYKILTFLENTLNKGKDFWGYSNWNIVKNKELNK